MSSHSNRPDASDRTDAIDRPNVSPERTTATDTTADRAVRVAALRAEADLLRTERGDLEAQVDALEAEVASLEAEVASLESALDEAHAETERVRRRYEGIIAEKDRAYRRAADDEPDGPLASIRARVGAVTDWLRRD